MTKTKVSRRCLYCMQDSEVANFSVRNIPGYRNATDGTDKAFVEKLACGHEYVDGKFNVDSIYHFNPVPQKPEPVRKTAVSYVPVRYVARSRPFGAMDIAVAVCMLFLTFAAWPLAILPMLYFMTRNN